VKMTVNRKERRTFCSRRRLGNRPANDTTRRHSRSHRPLLAQRTRSTTNQCCVHVWCCSLAIHLVTCFHTYKRNSFLLWPWSNLWPWPSNLTLVPLMVNQHAKYLGQRSFNGQSILELLHGHIQTDTDTHTHTPLRLLYLDHWSGRQT